MSFTFVILFYVYVCQWFGRRNRTYSALALIKIKRCLFAFSKIIAIKKIDSIKEEEAMTRVIAKRELKPL
jgi:hypothetical protein